MGTAKRFWAGLAAVALVSLGGTAAAEEGVTDTEIRLGQWGPQSGPAAPWGAVARGSGMLFQMINDEGGIHGRKIDYRMFDDGYNPAKTKAGVKELQEGPGIFAWVSGVGTAPGLAVRNGSAIATGTGPRPGPENQRDGPGNAGFRPSGP